jgi:ABC-type multidrug transport system fused ATPase/permease subunit
MTKKKKNSSIVLKSLKLLNKKDRKKLIIIIFFQIILGGLDLIGVAFIGVLGALAVSGISLNSPGDRVSQVLRLLQIDNYNFGTQAVILGLLAAGFMVSKTILSMFFTKKSLTFLSYRSAEFSAELARRILSQQYIQIRNSSNQEILYGLTAGANNLILGVLGAVVSIISDLSLVIVMLIGLFVIEPTIAFGSLFFFSLIGLILHRNLSHRAINLGQDNANLSIKVNEAVMDVLDVYRELFVRNKLTQYVNEIENSRIRVAKTTATMAFLPYISKYVLETSIVLGTLLLAGTQFFYQDTARAFGNIAIFLAAGTRIAPAVLRFQQGLLQIKTSSGGAAPTLATYEQITTKLAIGSDQKVEDFEHHGFTPEVIFSDVSFKYKGNSKFAIKHVNLKIEAGKIVALVGNSGAGKTTLADLLLGVITPDNGTVLISSKSPKQAIIDWPGAIAYVPQDVVILSTSISRNISLNPNGQTQINSEQIRESIKKSQLEVFVKDLVEGPESFVGERGSKLSGGQRQRLGISRALYSNPKLIIMDEATSSLDAETEYTLNETIQNLRGRVTIVVIAHRLATVRNADIVCYINNGTIEAQGSFEEVRKQVHNFDKQAKLLGL